MRTANLKDEDRQRLALFILSNSTNGRINRGILAQAVIKFAVCKRTCQKVWTKTKNQIAADQHLNLTTKKKGKKSRTTIVFDEEIMNSIPVRLHSTVRSIANQCGVSKSTVWRWIKRGLIRSHTSAIKPLLTPRNQLQRLKYVLGKVQAERNSESSCSYKELDHVVHIDEKWFNITKASNRYYLTAGEKEPYRACQSKRYITKVMFMCAVSRPEYGVDGEVIFDGKIGIFPFTYVEPAKRKSKNRAAGTVVTKPIESINKPVIRQCIIEKVIPAIKERWPSTRSKNIVIQQDNAKPHLGTQDTLEFLSAAKSDGFNISLPCQPPNSPDLNVLDSGFFRAIQSLQTEMVTKTIDDLVSSTVEAYGKLSADTLDKIFISLQACMTEIMKKRGHNDYALPHLGKNRLARLGLLKRILNVNVGLLNDCLGYLEIMGESNGLEELKSLLEMQMVVGGTQSNLTM